ncbi:MAG TPA: hypothetical protein VGR37_21900 [Longimicrobiaceae bacterium]|nr:hypothetical protein [Longimicrobiaceae bacterium]
MRGYARDYENRDYRNDREGWLSGGSEVYRDRDRMRHNPSWEDQEYGNRSGYPGGLGRGDTNWRRRVFEAGRGYGRDYQDRGAQRPMANRGGRGYDRGMQGQRPGRNRGMDDPYYGDDARGFGLGGGLGTYRPSGSFSNPTTRGDFFIGYGGATRRGYSPYW